MRLRRTGPVTEHECSARTATAVKQRCRPRVANVENEALGCHNCSDLTEDRKDQEGWVDFLPDLPIFLFLLSQ
jgi:hypothetical protein